jgi:NADH:ubiquinone oxidoreductase subunit E
MVLGAGIAGIQASLDLADIGYKVYLVEEKPSIGGVMAQLDKTFPTNDCAMCLLSPKLVDTARHPNIELLTNADLVSLEGVPGRFTAKIEKRPRFVDADKCTGCGTCMNNCPVRNIAHFEQPEQLELPELPEEDRAFMEKTVKDLQDSKGALIAVLQAVNSHYRYLPADALTYVSVTLGVPMSQVYSLATFYNTFSLTPKGRCIIKVCLGTACHVRGGQRLLERLERDLKVKEGETTSDREFTLEAVRCLGCCGLAPVLTFDDEVHGKAKPAQMPKLLEAHRTQKETA